MWQSQCNLQRTHTRAGLVIDSAAMVGSITKRMDERLLAFTYRVRLNGQGRLEWHGRINDREVIETKEPLTSLWLRFKAWFMKIVPESQL